jgi:chromosome segregation ATPase
LNILNELSESEHSLNCVSPYLEIMASPDDIAALQAENRQLLEVIATKNWQISHLDRENRQLGSRCNLLEGQVGDLVYMIRELDNRNKQLEAKNVKLKQVVYDMHKELCLNSGYRSSEELQGFSKISLQD